MVQRFAELPEDLMDDDGLPTLRASRGMSESQLTTMPAAFGFRSASDTYPIL